MSFLLRAALPADLEAVSRLARSSPQAPQWSLAQYESLLVNSAVPTCCLVAELEEQIAGFVIARLVAEICELESIAVAPKAQRRGIGAALLNSALQWAASHGALRLQLEVRASNLPAILLYQQAGLQREGVRRGYYSHPDEDAILMGIEPLSDHSK
ncbi:ribosomal protein S18-alanine N-acetyltransferase [Acidipila rosea]|uniref:[Ribosomal protein bS18]-alanine N-acetyltransferase n=1 Tax=Acidipila rosea TaxID=768535 RepID=A0A4V6NES3_9BACT|nr:ribosomal protein S18-alanine N-acetyltransferase [Acidipila rosea]TCK72091.1 ribosomal-protein-alanine N-acetyltransferase [Acidipila rosea]